MAFYQNFIRMCNTKGVSPSKAAEDAGTTKASVNRWKNGSIPSDATLEKLASYFQCSAADFLKNDDKPATQKDDGHVRAKVEQLTAENLAAFHRILEILAENPELIQPTLGILEIKSKTSP